MRRIGIVPSSLPLAAPHLRPIVGRTLLISFLFASLLGTAPAQTSSSSSSHSSQTESQESTSLPGGRVGQVDPTGSSVTLETSESLFDVAVALNACGYDADLSTSNAVRTEVRQEVNDALTSSAPARDKRDALCTYIQQHTLADRGRSLAQYVSLALYLSPPPELTPEVSEAELPPDSTQVVNVLPLLRDFADAIHLHAIWFQHRPEYEALTGQLHDPLTRTILDTNVYLRAPVSTYDGRRFLVLLEPMLSPAATNARIYGTNYIIVVSPSAAPNISFHMDEIRHTYLHYEVEPMVYARAAAMDRLLPLLKSVQDAPLDFTYKSDIVALLAECLIKAIEARTMDVGLVRPKRPTVVKQRSDMEHYDAEMSLYDRQAEAIRRRSVDLSMRQGWVLVDYFYGELARMEKDSISLRENIGQMIYGMDVDRERHRDQQIAFLPETTHEVVRRSAPKPTGLRLAEVKLMQGDAAGAQEIADHALADPAGDHAEAHYILARIDVMERQPEEAIAHFQSALATSKDPRTLAWSHIYLGRLYDVQSSRKKALEEYGAALTVRDSQPDTKAAAEKGMRSPFALPKREVEAPVDDDNAPIDPTGKAEKDKYRPSTPQ